MRYFRAFYSFNGEDYPTRGLEALHAEFDDKVFALPYSGCCYSNEGRNDFAVTVIAKDGGMGIQAAHGYISKAMGIWRLDDAQQTSIEECTVEDCFMESLCRVYHSCSFDESQVRRMLNLGSTYSFISSGRGGMKEYVVESPLDADRAGNLACQTPYSKTLREELSRIFAPTVCASRPCESLREASGGQDAPIGSGTPIVPIAYIVEGNTPSDAEDAIRILMGAMLAGGRVGSGHVFCIDVDDYRRWYTPDPSKDFRGLVNHQLMRAIEGNSLVLRYGMRDSGATFDVEAYEVLTTILGLVDDAACQTQLFISVPEGREDLVMRLRRRIDKPIVVIGKDKTRSISAASFESNLGLLEGMADAKGVPVDDSLGILLSKRMRGGRAVGLEEVFDEWVCYRDACAAFPQYSDVINQAIMLGTSAGEVPASERLNGLIGLDGVKRHINDIVLRVEMGKVMHERGIPMQPFSMHMAFLGAPGTGKTEVARLYAEILKEKGILSEGRLITVSGGAKFDVEGSFEAARGSVLFVDEAYGMLGCPGMVTEFIAQMENHRDDTVVILAGYEGQMGALLNSNPGFRSRVQTTINFPDYSDEELQRIFRFLCEKQQLVIGEGVDEAVRDVLARGGKRDDQGNARFVRKMFEDAVGAQQVRLARTLKGDPEVNVDANDLRTLLPDDVNVAASEMGVIRKKREKSGREALDSLIGLDEVKKLVSDRMDFAKIQKVKRDSGMDAPFVPMHMAFKGNPGTGKTEVARLVGRILREEGVLSVGDFFECGQQDLVSPVVGASAAVVESLFREAKGSVIFIDEAYSLLVGGKGGPGEEAVTAIIDQMEKLREEVVVIFAGYTKEVDELFASNPGFNSRVKVQLEFPDYGTDELVGILHSMADREGYVLESAVDDKVRELIGRAAHTERFGNARFVRNLFENALVEQSVRLASEMRAADEKEVEFTEEKLSTLTAEDFRWESASARIRIGFAA